MHTSPRAYALALSLALLLPSLTTYAQSAPEEEITVHPYAADGDGAMANAYVVEGARSLLLVDVPMSVGNLDSLAALIRGYGKPLRYVFVTHAHPDHYIGLGELLGRFPGARAVSSGPVATMIAEQGPAMLDILRAKRGNIIPSSFAAPEALSGERFALDGATFTVVPFGAGEAGVSAGLFHPSSGALFTGDVVYNGVHLFLKEGNPRGWAEQIATARALDATTVYPGHGAPTTPAVYDQVLAYLRDFEAAPTDDIEALSAYMTDRYPDYAMPYFLNASAEAATAE